MHGRLKTHVAWLSLYLETTSIYSLGGTDSRNGAINYLTSSRTYIIEHIYGDSFAYFKAVWMYSVEYVYKASPSRKLYSTVQYIHNGL